MSLDVTGFGHESVGHGFASGKLQQGIPVEDFEGDLSAWNGDSITAGELVIVTGSGHEVNGSGALHHVGGAFSTMWSNPQDGLSYYPQYGDRVRWYFETAQLTHSMDLKFGRADSDNFYIARVDFGNDRIQCDPLVNGTAVENNWDKNLGLQASQTYVCDFDWQSTKIFSIWPLGSSTYDATNPLGSADTGRTDFDDKRAIEVSDNTASGEEAWTDYIHVL